MSWPWLQGILAERKDPLHVYTNSQCPKPFQLWDCYETVPQQTARKTVYVNYSVNCEIMEFEFQIINLRYVLLIISRFNALATSFILKVFQKVINTTNCQLPENIQLEEIAECCNGDLRSGLNTLQLILTGWQSFSID